MGIEVPLINVLNGICLISYALEDGVVHSFSMAFENDALIEVFLNQFNQISTFLVNTFEHIKDMLSCTSRKFSCISFNTNFAQRI